MKTLLKKLSEEEYTLIKLVQGLKGSIEEKDFQIEKLNIPVMYKIIHSKYTENIENDVEALKRAIFIQWYAVVEPMCYTGINELDKMHEEQNIRFLNKLCKQGLIDKEFQIMLWYYFSLGDWYFNLFGENASIQRILLKNNFNIKDIKTMQNRGQMGEYWNSLNK